MPRLRSTSRVAQAPSRRRTTKWGVGPKAEPLSHSASNQQIGTGVILLLESEVTIVRMRGEFFFMLLTAAATGDGFAGAIGIGLVSNEAFAIGAAAVPGPVSEQDWDGWLWHSFFHSGFAIAADASVGVALRIPIDSKAMRKWSEGYTLCPVVEVTENGTSTAESWFQSRLLLKLS